MFTFAVVFESGRKDFFEESEDNVFFKDMHKIILYLYCMLMYRIEIYASGITFMSTDG